MSSVHQFSSVSQSYIMGCIMPGFPVHHQLPDIAQTHVHQVGDATQQFHLLSSPLPSAFNLSLHQVFSDESVLPIRWPKHWRFSFCIDPSNEYSGLISLTWTGWIYLQSKGLSRVLSSTQFKSINSVVLSFLYGPTLTSTHDFWKNHSFDSTDLYW